MDGSTFWQLLENSDNIEITEETTTVLLGSPSDNQEENVEKHD